MATFRVNKTKDYTVMSNAHLRDKNLSLKAKGILSLMLSLPKEWDYSLAGLATLASDGMSATRSAIKELEEHGYLIRRPIREKGRITDWEYIIFETPQQAEQHLEKPLVDFQQVENLTLENRTQLNTKELNTKELNTKEKRKKEERKRGYDEILSEIEPKDLRDLYLEYIKMRKLIKSPMTDRALAMLINRVDKIEPDNIERKKQMLETAIMNNWKNVYPIKDEEKAEEKEPKRYGGTYL